MARAFCDSCSHDDFHHPATGCSYWDPSTGDFCGCDTFTVNCKNCGHSHLLHRPVSIDGDETRRTRCTAFKPETDEPFCDCEEFLA